ncbi:MAG: hypothetical protein E7Z91_03260 [Cyanobacteria bacterium SIG30]|nr:hypothetical protein [Cyanobacteria bacterium SIG30]
MITGINNKLFSTINFKGIQNKPSFGRSCTCQTQEDDCFCRTTEIKNTPLTKTSASAKEAYSIFRSKIRTIFYDCCESKISNPAQNTGRIYYDKNNFYKTLNNIEKTSKSALEMRNKINDSGIINSRIILNEGTINEGNKIISKLIKAVKDEKIKVKEVRVYTERNFSSYASGDRITKLVESATNKNGFCKRVEKRKDTGYHGIHVLCELDDGFVGEIQIMGEKISKLKDIEDVLYRLSNGKPVKKGYEEIKKAYDELDEEGKRNLIQYTKENYFAEREKELGFNFNEDYVPVIARHNLPKIFDFNNLAKIKAKADRI